MNAADLPNFPAFLDELDEDAKPIAQAVTSELMQAVQEGVNDWYAQHSNIPGDRWDAYFEPALLSCILHNVSVGAREASSGWRTVFVRNLERAGKEREEG